MFHQASALHSGAPSPKRENNLTVADELRFLLQCLLKRHSKTAIAQRIGVHYDTVGGIILGRPAKHRNDAALLEKVHSLYVSELGDMKNVVLPVEDEQKKVTDDLEPKFLLTPDTFTAHQLELGKQYVQFARSSIENTRRLLDLAAQHGNEDVRQKIQEVLTPEVQELYLAIKRFSSAHPNKLLDVFAAESVGFALDRKSRNSKSKG